MTPTNAQVEAVAKALHNHRTAGDDLYDSWEEEVGLSGRNMLGKAYVYKVRGEARAAIAALDIEKIEREAYERGMKDIAEVVEQWYDNYCNHIPQADLMRVLATVMEGLR
jgi:hypothetical protein